MFQRCCVHTAHALHYDEPVPGAEDYDARIIGVSSSSGAIANVSPDLDRIQCFSSHTPTPNKVFFIFSPKSHFYLLLLLPFLPLSLRPARPVALSAANRASLPLAAPPPVEPVPWPSNLIKSGAIDKINNFLASFLRIFFVIYFSRFLEVFSCFLFYYFR